MKRKGGKEKRRRRRLPAALQGLMGEANLRFARGEFDEAIKMCMEVIRQFSHSPEPYQVNCYCVDIYSAWWTLDLSVLQSDVKECIESLLYHWEM